MSAILAAVLELHRVGAVQVGAGGDAVGVAVPEGADVVGGVQAEVVGVFAETVQVWVFRQRSTEAEVLVLEDEGCCRGVEEDFLIGLAGDLEAEWALLPGEGEVGVVCGNTIGFWALEHSVGDLVGRQRSILDLDVKALCFGTVSIWK